jgi:DNA polymerase-3 subunit alpha
MFVLVIKSSHEKFEDAYALMKALCAMGMRDLGWEKSKPHTERLQQELADVRIAWENNSMDFATYFLIVWDYINFARERKILTGCGRGSGYASVILRALKICYGPDPIKYGLLWERFLSFDWVHSLQDKDWGFGDIEDSEPVVIGADLDEAREVEDDEGGADRY